DLALSLRKARQGVHDQQHALALVAEILRDRSRAPRTMQTHQRWIVRRGRHNHGTTQPFRPEDALDEFLHLASTLTDQTDDDHVGAGVPCHHAEQHALANTAAGKQSDTLTAPYREQRIDRAHAHIERFFDRTARQRIDGRAYQANTILAT